MKLKIKFLKWSAGLPVVMLDNKTALKLGLHPKDRVLIKTLSKKPLEISTVVDTSEGLIKKNQIAISSEIKERYNLKNGQKVEVNFAPLSETLKFILKKLDGKSLSEKEIGTIINDISKNAVSEAEMALFISAMYQKGMSMKETIYLIDAMSKSGGKLNLDKKKKPFVDKHSIGGVPGNRTTPLVVAICAAAGLTFPKNSSRAITSAAGTADVIGAIAKVNFNLKQLKKIVNKTSACMVWGGGLGLVPVDTKLIQIEKSLNIDPKSQLLASIMSKKLAVGSTHILIDIPYGKGAKVSLKEAKELKKDFGYLGKHFKKKIKVVLTNGQHPIGRGIGPTLELKDILKIFQNDSSAPADLREKSIYLSGQIFELAGKSKKGNGEKLAREMLNSGKAFEKFKEIIKEQKGNLNRIKESKHELKITAKSSGKIFRIDNKKLALLARMAGAPTDVTAGVYLNKKVGEKFKKGETLLTIHAESYSRLYHAFRFYKKEKPLEMK